MQTTEKRQAGTGSGSQCYEKRNGTLALVKNNKAHHNIRRKSTCIVLEHILSVAWH